MSHDASGATDGRNTPTTDADDVLGATGSTPTTDVRNLSMPNTPTTGSRNALVLPVVSNVPERPAAVARSPAGQEAQEEHPIAAADVVPDAAARQVLQRMLTDASAPVQLVQVPKMSIGIRVANTGIMVGWFPVDPTIALRKLLLDYCAACGFHLSQFQFHWHVDGRQI